MGTLVGARMLPCCDRVCLCLQLLPAGCRVIRVMSNTPALVHRGASMYTCGNEVSIEDSTLVKAHFSSVGYCEEIDEDMMDAVTGLSGNGPAYVSNL